jgi:hypothetical protein
MRVVRLPHRYHQTCTLTVGCRPRLVDHYHVSVSQRLPAELSTQVDTNSPTHLLYLHQKRRLLLDATLERVERACSSQ